MSLTGEDIRSCFENSAEKHEKIFFETEKDDSNFNRLAVFFIKEGGIDIAIEAVDKFMVAQKQPVVFLLDFVVTLGSIVSEIKMQAADRAEFRKLVQETKARMEGE